MMLLATNDKERVKRGKWYCDYCGKYHKDKQLIYFVPLHDEGYISICSKGMDARENGEYFPVSNHAYKHNK